MNSPGFVLACAGLALLIGPFLGILADRLVDRVRPTLEHRCSSCMAPLGRSSLVPIVHLTQRCTECGSHKGKRYVAVDVLTMVAFFGLAARFGPGVKLVPYLALGAVLVVLSVVDAETHLLPNVVVWPSIFSGVIAVVVLSQVLGESSASAALLGAAVFSGFIGAAHLAFAAGMGRGDVKLAVLLGLFVGWLYPDAWVAARLVLYAVVLALFGGAFGGILYNLVRGRGRAEVPFGPALASASLLIIVLSPLLEGIVGA